MEHLRSARRNRTTSVKREKAEQYGTGLGVRQKTHIPPTQHWIHDNGGSGGGVAGRAEKARETQVTRMSGDVR